MQTETIDTEISMVQEPQLDFLYYSNPVKKKIREEKQKVLNVLSLFSGVWRNGFRF